MALNQPLSAIAIATAKELPNSVSNAPQRDVTTPPPAHNRWSPSERITQSQTDAYASQPHGNDDARSRCIQSSSITGVENNCSHVSAPTATSKDCSTATTPFINPTAPALCSDVNQATMGSQWSFEQQQQQLRLQQREYLDVDMNANTNMKRLSPLDTSMLSLSSHSRSRSSDDTPPLTPDMAYVGIDADSSPGEQLPKEELEDDRRYIERHHALKQEKQPAQPIDYEAPIDDVAELPEMEDEEALVEPDIAMAEENDEWLGLEYAIELSVREQRMTELQESSGGEHSKSRESWAMQRHGWVPPFLEEEDYYQWCNWHHYLDQLDDIRRYPKAYEFNARSEEMAGLFVRELDMRDMMYWQKDVYGGTSVQLKENLASLAQHCPDPYFPKEKHNLAWLLKRHRSVASLRELYKKEHPEYPMAVDSNPTATEGDDEDEDECEDGAEKTMDL